jgi:ParB-like chromosome segregation protein Spo0J
MIVRLFGTDEHFFINTNTHYAYPVKLVDIASLEPHENSLRREHEDSIKNLIGDLSIRGQQVPIDIRENTVLNGIQRVAAARILGWKKIWAFKEKTDVNC